MTDIVALDEFNGTLKRLVRFAAGKSKKLKLGGAEKKLRLLLDDAPLAALEVLGPLLDKHRQRISASDEKYFMETDFTADIPQEFIEDAKDIIFAIIKVKKIYSAKCKPTEKNTVLADMKQLLNSYDAYTICSAK